MSEANLLQELRKLEIELHRSETRKNARRLDELLHAEFVEIGRSGRRYSRSEMLHELRQERRAPRIEAWQFSTMRLCRGLALLSYQSARILESGERHRHAIRTSVWKLSADRWQMIFHQGTPCIDSESADQ